MKVLLVSQPASDGVFRHVEGLAKYLLAQGIEIHLAYSDRAACDQLQPLVDRIAAAGGRTLNLRVGNAPGAADGAALFALRRLVRAVSPEVIHAHSSKAGALVRGLAFFGSKARIFYTPHAYYRMHAPTGAKARVFHAIERRLAHRGTTIALAPDEAAFARARIGVAEKRLRILPNGVNCARYRPATPEEKRALRAQFGVPPDALVLGTCGRFSAQKDPLTTYAALAKIAPDAPDLFFVHLGKGELEPEVDALLAQHGLAARCQRIPYLADTSPFYRMLDGFVLASLYEGMSYALLEALSTNLPLILTQAPGNRDFAEVGLDRLFWAPPADIDALAEAFLSWRREAVSGGPLPNHRSIALKQFSLEASYARLLAAYREAAAERGQAGRLGAP